MIVAEYEDRLRVVTQNDHAHFSAELLSLWRDDGLPDHPRRQDLLFATRQHDNGWWEADSAPRVNPETGHPHDFLTMPREIRQEIWLRGTDRYRATHPYATLLILHHALHLHRDRDDDSVYARLLEVLRQRKEELLEELGIDDVVATGDYAFLDLTDLLSLLVCNRWFEPRERRGIRASFDGEALHLDPFPLAGATTFRLAYRDIPDRTYTSDTDLTLELVRSPWREAQIRVIPLATGSSPVRAVR